MNTFGFLYMNCQHFQDQSQSEQKKSFLLYHLFATQAEKHGVSHWNDWISFQAVDFQSTAINTNSSRLIERKQTSGKGRIQGSSSWYSKLTGLSALPCYNWSSTHSIMKRFGFEIRFSSIEVSMNSFLFVYALWTRPFCVRLADKDFVLERLPI